MPHWRLQIAGTRAGGTSLGMHEHLQGLRKESLVSGAPCWKEFTDLPPPSYVDKDVGILESTERFVGSSTRHKFGCELEFISRKSCPLSLSSLLMSD